MIINHRNLRDGWMMRKLCLHRVFTPISLPCYDFVSEDGKRRRVTVLIARVKLVEFEDGSLGVSFACSRD